MDDPFRFCAQLLICDQLLSHSVELLREGGSGTDTGDGAFPRQDAEREARLPGAEE
ncbi:hypothetical protein AB0I22_20770 [Streptomyces sp. NPDC050610]|uniref:hypothetical protein n=1 Tax=Streptomyces sp. NPDC050610 TaxID=3157097 RepID=UPI00343F1684